MKAYKTPMDVWQALSNVDKGQDRAAILKKKKVRDLVLNSGSFVIFTTGDAKARGGFGEKFSDIRLFQTQRIRPTDGAMDGKGTFGGMSERTSDEDYKTLREKGIFSVDLEKDIFSRDDLVLSPGADIQKTFDLNDIARVSAARETMEEFVELTAVTDIYNKLGIEQDGLRFSFAEAALTPIPLHHVHDDNYIINIWSGDLEKPAYAISPFGHLVSIDQGVFDYVLDVSGKETKPIEAGREISHLTDISLFDALKQWGKLNADGTRDLSHDYRYPHEWMGVWRKAQLALNLHCGGGAGLGARQVEMCNLMAEVQESVIDDAVALGQEPHQVNILGALIEMNGGRIQDLSELEKFEEDFDLPHGTFNDMQEESLNVLRDNGFNMSPKIQEQHLKV